MADITTEAEQAGTDKTYNGEFKAKVALEALQETMPLNELASKYEVHPDLISRWKAEYIEGLQRVFCDETQESQELKRLRRENKKLKRQVREQEADKAFLEKNLKKLGLL